MTNICLITAVTGGGHLALAEAIKSHGEKKFPNHFSFDLFNPFPDTYRKSYIFTGIKHKRLFQALHRLTQLPPVDRLTHLGNYQVIRQALLKHLIQHQPEVIITNHPLASVELKWVSHHLPYKPKIVCLLSDPFTIHPLWFDRPFADLYLSPNDTITQIALSHHIPKNIIVETGWVIRPIPEINLNQHQLRLAIGFDPQKPVIFIGGSGIGFSNLPLVLESFSQDSFFRNHQFIINPGINVHLIKLSINSSVLIRKKVIIPYTSNPYPLFQASDILIGKAGPSFIYESLALKRPFILADYVEGQEKPNIDYVLKNKLGAYSRNPAEIVAITKNFYQHRSALFKNNTIIASINARNRNAPDAILNAISNLL